MKWGLFMSSSMRAAIHLEQNYERNLETYKSTDFEQIENLFTINQNLVVDNPSETLDSRSLCWARSTLAHDQVKSWSKAKVRVYSDSILCLGKMSSGEEAEARWSSQVSEFQEYCPVEEFLGIDGEAIEFEWNLVPRFTTLQIPRQIENESTTPEQFLDRIMFMCMFNDIDWTKRNNEETCTSNSEQEKWYAQKFQTCHWTFMGPGDEWKWLGTRDYRPEGK